MQPTQEPTSKEKAYFMATAFLAATRSKDPSFQVGACIVNKDKKIVGVGYNGMPNGCKDKDFPWSKDTENEIDPGNKHFYVCHGELNAILNKNLADLKGCEIYVVLFPCYDCAKMVIQSGITKVYYAKDKKNKATFAASEMMLHAAGVRLEKFENRIDKIYFRQSN